MVSRTRLLVAGTMTVWAAVFAFSLSGDVTAAQKKRTTNDAVFTKAQADGAKAQYEKMCADCHPFTAAAKKKPKDIPLGEEPFFEEWTGRPVSELANLIALTMPNDGSGTVTDAEALDLVAFILHKNGAPAGSKKLTKQSASAVIERPKK